MLIGARIARPYAVLHYANKSLANLKSLYGHIDDVDIEEWDKQSEGLKLLQKVKKK